jgi:hypothetical protein
MIVNDDPSIASQLETSLIDDARVVIYDHHMFIVQAPGCKAGAMTLSLTTLSMMTFSITTLSIKALYVTLGISDTQHKRLICDTRHKCHSV